MTEKKIVAMPGIQPRVFRNVEAADALQAIVDKLRCGEAVGVAWVHINRKGMASTGWNAPSGMSNDLYSGAAGLVDQMMRSRG